MRVKFCVIEQTEGLRLHGKFHVNVFIVSVSGGKNPQFWANFDIWGLLNRLPFTDEGQIWCPMADPRYTLKCQNSSRSVYSAALCAAKNPNFCRFWTSAFSGVVSTVGGNLRALNTSAQLQTFPYPTASKSFLFSNTFMAKLGAQTLTFKSATNRQTKNSTFWPPRRRVKSEPHQAWHGDRGSRACSCISKTFGGLTHSFAARRR